jgi:RNA polymerase sigma factor (sigma-70 family)
MTPSATTSASTTTSAASEAADQKAREFIGWIASGGPQANKGLEGLFKLYASRMRAFFKKHRMSDEDASDLIQDTFIKVNRAAHQFKGDSKPSTWIWTIARNTMLDHLRAQSGDVSLDEEEVDLDAILQSRGMQISAAETSRNEDITDCVQRHFSVFAKESPERASTLQLAVVEGWTMEELAEYLKRTPAATREYLSQCRKKLKEYLLPCADLVGG